MNLPQPVQAQRLMKEFNNAKPQKSSLALAHRVAILWELSCLSEIIDR